MKTRPEAELGGPLSTMVPDIRLGPAAGPLHGREAQASSRRQAEDSPEDRPGDRRGAAYASQFCRVHGALHAVVAGSPLPLQERTLLSKNWKDVSCVVCP